MEYKFMEPPLEVLTFKAMTKNESLRHYEWYISEIPIRMEQLRNAYAFTSGKNCLGLDYSKESLVKLWGWYLDNVEIVEKDHSELQIEFNQNPDWVKGYIQSKKIELGWLSVAMDIGIYFSESLVRANQNLKWGVVTTPKTLVYVNKPVVKGFRANICLDSSIVLSTMTKKVIDGVSTEESLAELFDIWLNRI